MRSEQKIEPEKVTKPIQLLAAWLIGLIIVNGSFLATASVLREGSWEGSALVIAAIANVPLFLIAMVLLQTKFRPELQEDLFYSQYLDKKTNKVVTISKDEKIESELISIKNQITALSNNSLQPNESAKKTIMAKKDALGIKWLIGLNDLLDDFADIRKLLKQEGIPLSNLFGSKDSNNKPKHKVIAFSRLVDFDSKRRILLFGSKAGFEGYSYYEVYDEEATEEQILLGAYGDPDFPITPELVELLNLKPEPVDLRYFESRNKLQS